jgi:hypothetical protein
MVAPATEQIATQFGITSEVLIAMTVSIFVLGYAVGPLVSSDVFAFYTKLRSLEVSWTS